MSILDVQLPEDGVARTLTSDVKIALEQETDETLLSDCGFLLANREAEDLYGCRLKYRYKSQFRRPKDTFLAQCRHVRALQGIDDPNASTLNYLLRAGGKEGVWVRQEVETFRENGITYWLTALYPASQSGTFDARTPEEIGVTRAQVQAVCGRLTMLDVQSLPRTLTPALALATIIPRGLKICKVTGQSSVLVGALGAYLRRFIHCCQLCGHVWSSVLSRPRTCARRGQGEDSSCGTKRWWRQ